MTKVNRFPSQLRWQLCERNKVGLISAFLLLTSIVIASFVSTRMFFFVSNISAASNENGIDGWWLIGSPDQGMIDVCVAFPDNSPTLKILVGHREMMAAHFYDLAKHARELSPHVSREQFQRSIQGAHFRSVQVTNWIDSLSREAINDHPLIGELESAGFLHYEHGRWVSTERYENIIAIATEKERLLYVLVHELLHVRWHYDQAFRDGFEKAWSNLSGSIQDSIQSDYETIGYCRTNIDAIREEWAVRETMKKYFNPSAQPVTPMEKLWEITSIASMEESAEE